jgi:hypothetical protein
MAIKWQDMTQEQAQDRFIRVKKIVDRLCEETCYGMNMKLTLNNVESDDLDTLERILGQMKKDRRAE